MSLTLGPIHGKPCRCVRVRARCAAWTLPPIDVWLAPTVRGEWVAHCAGRFVERPLSQPGYPRGDGRLKVSNSPQRGQYVVGSNRYRDVPDDRLEYDTWRLGVRDRDLCCSLRLGLLRLRRSVLRRPRSGFL